MSATEIINDQMEKMRNELATANQQIGVITECLDIQEATLASAKHTPEGAILGEDEYKFLGNLTRHMHNACRRA
jgi:hypothetical protein